MINWDDDLPAGGYFDTTFYRIVGRAPWISENNREGGLQYALRDPAGKDILIIVEDRAWMWSITVPESSGLELFYRQKKGVCKVFWEIDKFPERTSNIGCIQFAWKEMVNGLPRWIGIEKDNQAVE